MKANKELVQQHIFTQTLKDLQNIADHDKDKMSTVNVSTLIEEMKKVDGEVYITTYSMKILHGI